MASFISKRMVRSFSPPIRILPHIACHMSHLSYIPIMVFRFGFQIRRSVYTQEPAVAQSREAHNVLLKGAGENHPINSRHSFLTPPLFRAMILY